MLQMMLTFCTIMTAMMIIRATSPYFGALATAGLALTTSLLLLQMNVVFPAMILMLIYLGGMLVVFIYSTAYAADLLPLPINMGSTVVAAFLGMLLITNMSPSITETVCEGKIWESYSNTSGYMLFDLYERGYGAFIVATIVLTVLLFSILELVSHRQTTMKWFVHSAN
uniref:NADH-ubiquinone oxidoreductase chain 6 n=1 Tax=Epigonichthys maldivensis TaxID=231028 RepID=A0A182C2T5_9BRAN|nr:NADH dehydrogenase subunit 6 [Epigonichthys maldivensis]